jgi:hypothetical protein
VVVAPLSPLLPGGLCRVYDGQKGGETVLILFLTPSTVAVGSGQWDFDFPLHMRAL